MPPDPEPDWNQLVERYSPRVFRIAYRIVGEYHDAEDVQQIVFTELLKIHGHTAVKSWTGLIVRLATLRSLDLLRRKRHTVQAEAERFVSEDRPEAAAETRELAIWLREAMGQLPEQQSAVFSLIYYEQLERDDVASILNVSPEAVSSALYKARQSLLSQFKIYQGDQSL